MYQAENQAEKMMRTQIELSRQLIFFEEQVEEGMKLLKEVLPKAEREGKTSIKARIHHILGYTYAEYLNDYSNALKNYYKALEFYDKNEDFDHKTTLLLNIAEVYYSYGSHKEAIKFLFQGLDMALVKGDEELIATFHNNLGVNYVELDDYRTAILYLDKAAKYYQSVGDALSYYQTQINIINLYPHENVSKERRTEILDTYTKAIPVFKSEGDYFSLMASLKNMASIENEMGNFLKAKQLLEELLEYEAQIPDLMLRSEAYKSLATTYGGMGEYKMQSDYLKKYVGMYDTLFNVAKTKAIAETRIKYQAEKIEDENSILKKNEEIQNAKLENEKLTRYGLVIGLGLIVLFAIFVLNRFLASQKQKKIIQSQKYEVDLAYSILETKNNEILDSINYAKRIQAAILPSNQFVKDCLPNSFIVYMPKDIVAGDFYWMETIQDIGLDGAIGGNLGTLLAVADCTGHGVPGAMVSVICNNGLNRAVREYGLTDPGNILDKTQEIVVKEFEKSSEDVKDGMDIALVCLENMEDGKKQLSFAGAHNPLWIIRAGKDAIEEIKADKQPIGKFSNSQPFSTKKTVLNPGDTFYIFSDGFVDQFGGQEQKPSGKKLKSKNFASLILSIQEKSMDEQRTRLHEFFDHWKGDLEQVDDVCVIGVRI
ncbi:MAG: SpoIIE family protein phosphatase [Crocinitomicaceae bacterium]